MSPLPRAKSSAAAALEELNYENAVTGVRGPVAELRHRLAMIGQDLPLNLANQVRDLCGYLDDLCSDARAIAEEIEEERAERASENGPHERAYEDRE